MAAKKSGVFKFQKHDSIGFPAAEQDSRFLKDCFVDTGDLSVLLDVGSPKAVIRGRTGAGKSALLSKVRESSRDVITIVPDQLAFNYITSASFITELERLDINLTPFYKHLWRHVIAIEVFRHIFPDGEDGNIFNRLLDVFRKKPKEKKAIEYLRKYSDQYWLNVQSATKEIIRHNEKEITGSLDTGTAGKLTGSLPSASAGFSARYSTTEKSDIKKVGSEWVSRSQTALLSALPSLLNQILQDEDRTLYIAIDGLDESWVEDHIRYKLLRALIGNVRDYNHGVTNLKLLMVLRQDLWNTVFRETQEKGQQAEKTGSLALDVTWDKANLLKVMDLRIETLVKDQYTTATIGFSDIFPASLGGGRESNKSTNSAIDYILERTWLRPRDAIEFVNLCIQNAEGKSVFNRTILQAAERQYSESRFQSLIDEWGEMYPGIREFIEFLRNRPWHFRLDSVPQQDWDNLALTCLCKEESGVLNELCSSFNESKISGPDYRKAVCELLYTIGAIGLKTESHLESHWYHVNNHSITKEEIPDNAEVYVHKALHRYLGCDQRSSTSR